MKNNSRFWNRIAQRYYRSPIADPQVYQEKLEKTREYLSPDMQVLEFGCGTGGTAISHAAFVKHLHAIDISPNMLEIARDQAKRADVHNLTFECADIDSFEATPGTYDVILGLSILHLVDDRDAVIAKVHSMLKPGGVFVSSTICLGDFMRILKIVGPIGRALGLLPMLRVFKQSELADSIAQAGFSIELQRRPGKKTAAFFIARKSPLEGLLGQTSMALV